MSREIGSQAQITADQHEGRTNVMIVIWAWTSCSCMTANCICTPHRDNDESVYDYAGAGGLAGPGMSSNAMLLMLQSPIVFSDVYKNSQQVN